jgi:hypothetical protein
MRGVLIEDGGTLSRARVSKRRGECLRQLGERAIPREPRLPPCLIEVVADGDEGVSQIEAPLAQAARVPGRDLAGVQLGDNPAEGGPA